MHPYNLAIPVIVVEEPVLALLNNFGLGISVVILCEGVCWLNIICCDADCRICVWNAADGSLVHSLTGHTQSVSGSYSFLFSFFFNCD